MEGQVQLTIDLLENERIDDLQRNGYKIIQNTKKFCFGMDAVLLSDFAKVKRNETAVDLGTGTGIIPILLRAKSEGKSFYGLEIQEEIANMAKRSVLLNDLTEDVEIIQGDIKNVTAFFKKDSVEVVTSNPPYMIAEHGIQNPADTKAISRHEICCDLRDVVGAAADILKTNGRFYMVHRPFRLAEIISVMKENNLEPKRMRLVYPFVDKEPNMVLIEGIKGAKSEIKIEKPLIVYDDSGQYTEAIKEIYGY